MPRAVGWLLVSIAAFAFSADAQPKRKPAPKTPAPPLTRTEAVRLDCPNVLGDGVTTARRFCDILTGRQASDGTVAHIPKHRGPATLTFDLHNRQMYSAELEKSGRAYAKATATIGVLTLEGDLIARALVRSEFRRASDLFDRISGGAGPGGVKAVAPVGAEPISVEIPEKVEAVSILGEKVVISRVDGEETVSAPGRPIAVISDVMVKYQPAPKAPAKKAKKK
jgi:hypothetical protein